LIKQQQPFERAAGRPISASAAESASSAERRRIRSQVGHIPALPATQALRPLEDRSSSLQLLLHRHGSQFCMNTFEHNVCFRPALSLRKKLTMNSRRPPAG